MKTKTKNLFVIKKNKKKNFASRFNELIINAEKSINNDLFRKYSKYQNPSHILENLNSTKNTHRNKIQVNLIESALTDLKNKIKNTSKIENSIEKPDKIVNILEKILDFNNQNQTGQGLKILTPNQVLSILLITLAQLQAGNKKRDKTTAIFFVSLKKLAKTICNTLINTI